MTFFFLLFRYCDIYSAFCRKVLCNLLWKCCLFTIIKPMAISYYIWEHITERKKRNVLIEGSWHDAYFAAEKKNIWKRRRREKTAKPYRIRLTYRCMYLWYWMQIITYIRHNLAFEQQYGQTYPCKLTYRQGLLSFPHWDFAFSSSELCHCISATVFL